MPLYHPNARSVGGVTVGNAWLRNNPDLVYPVGHEDMSDEELEIALRADEPIKEDVPLKPVFPLSKFWTHPEDFDLINYPMNGENDE